jgi:hypothetical protein
MHIHAIMLFGLYTCEGTRVGALIYVYQNNSIQAYTETFLSAWTPGQMAESPFCTPCCKCTPEHFENHNNFRNVHKYMHKQKQAHTHTHTHTHTPEQVEDTVEYLKCRDRSESLLPQSVASLLYLHTMFILVTHVHVHVHVRAQQVYVYFTGKREGPCELHCKQQYLFYAWRK